MAPEGEVRYAVIETHKGKPGNGVKPKPEANRPGKRA